MSAGESTQTLTADQLEELITARLTKHEETVRGQFADYDTLKAKAQELEELRRTNETETARLIREARETEQAKVPEIVGQRLVSARTAVLAAELRSQAVVAGFKYPEDVVRLLTTSPDISVDDQFNVKGAQKAVEKLAVDRPEWIGGTQVFQGAPPRQRASNGGGSTPDTQSLAQRIEARKRAIGAGNSI